MVEMENQDKIFMELALEEARLSAEEGEIPVGAVIVKDGCVLAKTHNTREKSLDISGHAEVNAIRLAEKALGRWTLEGCSLYVTLEPCLMCSGAIKQSRLASLVFGAKDEADGAVVSKYHVFDSDNGTPTIACGLMEKESAELLKEFFRKQREQ